MPQTSKETIANITHDILHPTSPAAVRKAHGFIHALVRHTATKDKGILRTRHGGAKESIPGIVVYLNVVRIGTLPTVAAVCDKGSGRRFIIVIVLAGGGSEALNRIVRLQTE
jgi:hypothetical protein